MRHSVGKLLRFVHSKAQSHIEEDAIQTLGVIGAGQIGTGVVLHTLTVTNKRIILLDHDDMALSRCRRFMEKHLERRVGEGRLTAERKHILIDRVTMSTSFHLMQEADFVLEAVSEMEEVKRSIFQKVMPLLRSDVVMASHTASTSITKLAHAVPFPQRVVGMLFMHPVQATTIVEVIAGLETSETSVNKTLRLAGALGKTAIRSADSAGFISFRVLMPMINEAIYALKEGVGSLQDIDRALRLGTGIDKGPLELADFIGLDTCLSIMRSLQTEFGSERYRPCPLLTQYVYAGRLGRKSGRGFYTYDRE